VIRMSNRVVLSGSMRKGGNTDLLVQAFAEGAGEKHSFRKEIEIVGNENNGGRGRESNGRFVCFM